MSQLWSGTYLRVDPVLSLIRNCYHITLCFALTVRWRKSTDCVEAVDLLDVARGTISLSFETQPLDVGSRVGRIAILCFLGLRVAQADDVEVGRRVVDEEVSADGLGRFLDDSKSSGFGSRVFGHGTRGVEELGDGANGCGRCSQVGSASVVLGSIAKSNEDKLHVGSRRREDTGWLRHLGQVALGCCRCCGIGSSLIVATAEVGHREARWSCEGGGEQRNSCEEDGCVHAEGVRVVCDAEISGRCG
jgi:hypothetical protein